MSRRRGRGWRRSSSRAIGATITAHQLWPLMMRLEPLPKRHRDRKGMKAFFGVRLEACWSLRMQAFFGLEKEALFGRLFWFEKNTCVSILSFDGFSTI